MDILHMNITEFNEMSPIEQIYALEYCIKTYQIRSNYLPIKKTQPDINIMELLNNPDFLKKPIISNRKKGKIEIKQLDILKNEEEMLRQYIEKNSHIPNNKTLGEKGNKI